MTVYRDLDGLAASVAEFKAKLVAVESERFSGLCGFDGFIDTFVRMGTPSSMAEFGPKVAAAAGIAASYPVTHLGDKFGGNGPLFASAMNDIHSGRVDVTYIGAMGEDGILPIYQEALGEKTKRLFSLAKPAHSTCLEFTDGKVMLGDLSACEAITLERLLECVTPDGLDAELKKASFIGAVNWGKLPHAGEIWSYLADRLDVLEVTPKKVVYFMDLAEFETRPQADVEELIGRMPAITRQCHTLLSFNLKEAWQMGEILGGSFHGRKDAEGVAELAEFLFGHIEVDRVIIHPNDGAACASARGTVYVPGPHCREPMISTGAGDNFGAGCLAAAIRGADDTCLLLAGNCASGHFVRSGRTASFVEMAALLDLWVEGTLGERL